jgi:carboxylate-amine ligase
VQGELIDTEIEIRSGRGETFAEAVECQRLRRERLFGIADERGLALAATGTHPWANYLDQHIIDTEHYRRLEQDLRWVAQRNNTWSLHVHVGIRGADRAVVVSDRMRALLPALLGLSANSPFLDHRETGLHSVRTEIFTRVFPRCGVHEAFGDWATYAEFVRLLTETRSIVEATQLWWSVRPHHSFGTVEVRICDAQTRGDESFNLAGLMVACVAQLAIELDEGRAGDSAPGFPDRLGARQREIEENLWRAIRYGMDGEMIDFRARRVMPTRTVLEELVEWTEPARETLGLEVELPEQNGAQRAYASFAEGAPIEEIYRRSVEETRRTYAPEGAVSGR